MDLKLMLRSSYTKRWTIVNVDREQNIAEHSYNVWLIAEAIWQELFPTPHNSDDYKAMVYLALTHDAHEVLMGDLPTTAKKYLPPHILDGARDTIRHEMGLPGVRSMAGTIPGWVVKIADTLEALHFAFVHIRPGDPAVLNHICRNYLIQLETARKAFPNTDWEKVGEVSRGILDDPRWVLLVSGVGVQS